MTYVIDTSDQRRRRAFRAATPLAALLVAALLVWQGSNAAFSASTDNTANAWETGNMMLENNGGGTVFDLSTNGLFDENDLRPGNSGAKCITVESTGSLSGDLRIYRGSVTGSALADILTITVDAVEVSAATNVAANCAGYTGGTGGALFNGTLNGMDDSYVAAAGTSVALDGGTERVAYRIGWTVQDAGNSLMDETTQADLVWEVR
ncbi:MAG TPA: hypothetical protein VFO17_02745 [Acidimicrobiia bacterium]|jgi:hypothetical protein|nr:hypothetical protein [Acidimicrobiia bacterium]